MNIHPVDLSEGESHCEFINHTTEIGRPFAANASIHGVYGQMKPALLALITILLLAPAAAYGQSVSRIMRLARAESVFAEPNNETEMTNDRVPAAHAIAALKRLDKDVLIYRSLGDFEEDGRLARVPYEAFQNDLQQVTTEVEPLLSRLPQGRLKTEIRNALESYRDGEFWWQKIYQPRVVNVSALTSETSRTQSDTALLATVPYTVAIHWRQAGRYLKHAEEIVNGTKK